MVRITLLGSTGSIGTQLLDIVRRHRDKFEIAALAAGSNGNLFLSQVLEFSPKIAGLTDGKAFDNIKGHIPKSVKKLSGKDVLNDISNFTDTDILVVAVSGFVGVNAVISGIKNRKRVAIATKEVLVSAGKYITELAREYGAQLIPLDSEHSAIFQALNFDYNTPFKSLILTASGGPFREYSLKDLKKVTVKDALNHPKWSMGKKITVDSATLMNKGLEIIEAKWLFNCEPHNIKAVIHPESIIHSMVQFNDGSLLAQMSYPTMEIPLQIALTYPKRLSSAVKPLDFYQLKSLNFFEIDTNKFPCYKIAVDCLKSGGAYPCIMNAANEIAVWAFLNGEISFVEIYELISRVLHKIKIDAFNTIEEIIAADAYARQSARQIISSGELWK